MIGFVINYSSLEHPFIRVVLERCSHITSHIAVAYGTHLYNGEPEVNSTTDDLKNAFPHVSFVQYEVDPTDDMTTKPGVVKRPTAYWCNLARWVGFQAIAHKVEWVFFIDADEIPDHVLLNEWFSRNTLDPRYVYKFLNYWYFKDVTHQATTHEDSILFVHKSYITETTVFHDNERDGIISMSKAPTKRRVGYDGNTPMFHHYSWVRTRSGLRTKLLSWAHRDDMFKGADVDAIVEYVYRDDNVNDFVHNYTYIKVPNIFGIQV